MTNRFWAAGLVFLMLLSGGCGYRLGSSLPSGIRSVYVPVFENKSDEPMIETIAVSAVLQEFQREGTLEVADQSFADTVLKVVITGFSLEPVRFDADLRKTTEEYRMRIEAVIEFSKYPSGEVLQTRRVFGESMFAPGGDLPSAKRAAYPDACRDLAHQIVKTVVEFW